MDIVRNFLQNIFLNKIKEMFSVVSIQEHYLSMMLERKIVGIQEKC